MHARPYSARHPHRRLYQISPSTLEYQTPLRPHLRLNERKALQETSQRSRTRRPLLIPRPPVLPTPPRRLRQTPKRRGRVPTAELGRLPHRRPTGTRRLPRSRIPSTRARRRRPAAREIRPGGGRIVRFAPCGRWPAVSLVSGRPGPTGSKGVVREGRGGGGGVPGRGTAAAATTVCGATAVCVGVHGAAAIGGRVGGCA